MIFTQKIIYVEKTGLLGIGFFRSFQNLNLDTL